MPVKTARKKSETGRRGRRPVSRLMAPGGDGASLGRFGEGVFGESVICHAKWAWEHPGYDEACAIAREGRNGVVFDPRWIRLSSDVGAVLRGCWFNVNAALHAALFIEEFCVHTKSDWEGKRFILPQWQYRDIIFPLFGWMNHRGWRRFREAFIEIARKNGKSTLAAALSVLLLAGDGERTARVAGCAGDIDQARIVFEDAQTMVTLSDDLNAEIVVLKKTISFAATNSHYHVLSADAFRKHGRHDSACIFDEMHVQPNSELYSVMWKGMAARPQPLMLGITTAGERAQGLCFDKYTHAIQILDGTIEDDTFFAYIREAEPKADWWRVEQWILANPGMCLDHWIEPIPKDERVNTTTNAAGDGVAETRWRLRDDAPWNPERKIETNQEGKQKTNQENGGLGNPPSQWDILDAGSGRVSPLKYIDNLMAWLRTREPEGVQPNLEYMATEARKGINSTTEQASFKWMNLNLWLTAKPKWINLSDWRACEVRTAPSYADRLTKWMVEMRGWSCFLALDLSSKLDLTALCALFPPRRIGDKWRTIEWYWLPEKTIERRWKESRVPYPAWAKAKVLNEIPGRSIDQTIIEDHVVRLAKHFNVVELVYDPWSATQFVTNLGKKAPRLKCVELAQTIKHLSEPSKEIERLIVSEEIEHLAHPITQWCFSNTVVSTDPQGNIRPNKEASPEKIDGVMAMITAAARATIVKPKRSVYAERGPIELTTTVESEGDDE